MKGTRSPKPPIDPQSSLESRRGSERELPGPESAFGSPRRSQHDPSGSMKVKRYKSLGDMSSVSAGLGLGGRGARDRRLSKGIEW